MPSRRPNAPYSLLRGAALVVLGAAAIAGVRWLLAPPPVPRIVHYRPLTGGSQGLIDSYATDGERAYFTVHDGTETRQVSLAGGASAPIALPFRFGYVVDASKARSSLLMVSGSGYANTSDGPLWSVPVPAGGARKLGINATWAAWSPDGQKVAFVANDTKPAQLVVARADGSVPTILFTSDDLLGWVGWSPDGTRLRMVLREADTLQRWVLEIPAAGGVSRRLFRGMAGDWSSRRRAFVFQGGDASTGWGPNARAGAESRLNLFVALEPSRAQPWAGPRIEQLTFGPLDMSRPVLVPGGNTLVVAGYDWHGELVRFDAKTSQFQPLLGGLHGGFLDYSWDGRWVAWVDAHELTLWRSRSDGSEPLQLTTPPFTAGLVRWSPDGKRLAFVGKPPDSLPRVYVMASDGGTPEPISPPEKGLVWDPCWLPDGKTVVWGRLGGGGIRSVDLDTRKLSVLPETDDLIQPKCSRQGLLLATRELPGEGGVYWTYDPRTGARSNLGVPATLAYPNFTQDGQSVIGCSGPEIQGFSLRDRRVRKIADLGTIRPNSPLFASWWVGLDAGDAPIILSDRTTSELYALELEWP